MGSPHPCRPTANRPWRALWRGLVLLALASLVWWSGCSDAPLYRGSEVAFQNDRLALTGRFCTVDPAEQSFPVKVLFLVDRSSEVAGLDPDFNYASAVDQVVQRFLSARGGRYSFGVIGYGGRTALLSGGVDNEAFTRQAQQLQNAVQLLRLPSPCENGMALGRCRDMNAALSLAASLISGDAVTLPKGEVARTRYVVIHFAAGAPSPRIKRCACGDPVRDPMCMNPPMITDQDCELLQYQKQLSALTAQVREAGASDLRYHTFYLRDPATAQLTPNDEAIALLQRLSAAGAGAFACRTAGALPDCDKLFPAPRSAAADAQHKSCTRQAQQCPAGVTSFLGFSLDSNQRPFLVKKLVVTNLNAVARGDGPHVDSDGDGLADDEERLLGTRPDNADSDGDGLGDLVELRLALDPLKADPRPSACATVDFPADLSLQPMPDSDGDLLNDCEERLLGTDATLADSDGDSLPDGLELRAGTNYLLSDYLLPPYDHDGIANGEEVRQHTQPRADDGRDALGRAYFYNEQDEGVRALPFTTQPRVTTGVAILDVSAGSTAGAGALRYHAAPLSCDAEFPAPRSAEQERAHERCGACKDCAALAWKDAGDCDFGPAQLVDPAAIRSSGPATLTLASRSAAGGCAMSGAMGDFRLIVRVENPAILPRADVIETIAIGTAQRDCVRYQVRNVSLLTPTADQTVGREESKTGMNNIYIYFAQGPEGQLEAPGIYSTALLRVRYNPPARREPSDAEIVLGQEDFVVLGGR